MKSERTSSLPRKNKKANIEEEEKRNQRFFETQK